MMGVCLLLSGKSAADADDSSLKSLPALVAAEAGMCEMPVPWRQPSRLASMADGKVWLMHVWAWWELVGGGGEATNDSNKTDTLHR